MTRSRIAVVTDSTAYIPAEALHELEIPTIPLWLHLNDKSYRDGVDIQPKAFYQLLSNSKAFPTTSQPSAGEFAEFFTKVGAEVETIVGVFISSKLSGTVWNAQAAAARLEDLDVRVVDSKSASMGTGLMALAAAHAAANGKSADDIVVEAERRRDCTYVIFAVDTLEYLHRGGRIGGAGRLLGTALNIKPLLQLDDGAIQPLAKVRTKRKAIASLLDATAERLQGKAIGQVSIINVNTPDEAKAVAQQVRERFGVSTVYHALVSPVIGAHVGPGTVGICFCTED